MNLMAALNDYFTNESISDIGLQKLYCDKRLESDITCPRCKSKNINRNGRTKIKRQRYKCKDCAKGFSEMTNSPLWYSKKGMEIWLEYLNCIREGLTLRKAAEKVSINLVTSFHWRHKILSVLGTQIIDNKLSGTIEVDELMISETFKGSREKNNCKKNESRFYREHSLIYGNLNNAISILSCKDNSNNVLFKAVTKGRLGRQNLDEILLPAIKNGEILKTIRNHSFMGFAKANKLRLCMVGNYQDNIERITVEKAKEQSKCFKRFLRKFRGIASKYLSYYINWYRTELNKEGSLIKLLNMFMEGTRQIRACDFKYVRYDGSLSKKQLKFF